MNQRCWLAGPPELASFLHRACPRLCSWEDESWSLPEAGGSRVGVSCCGSPGPHLTLLPTATSHPPPQHRAPLRVWDCEENRQGISDPEPLRCTGSQTWAIALRDRAVGEKGGFGQLGDTGTISSILWKGGHGSCSLLRYLRAELDHWPCIGSHGELGPAWSTVLAPEVS